MMRCYFRHRRFEEALGCGMLGEVHTAQQTKPQLLVLGLMYPRT